MKAYSPMVLPQIIVAFAPMVAPLFTRVFSLTHHINSLWTLEYSFIFTATFDYCFTPYHLLLG